MARQKGRNKGITGIFDIPGQNARFTAQCFAMSLGRQVVKKSRVGRGSGLYARFRLALLSGQLVIYANVDGNSPPEPATFRDEEGTVTLQFDAGKTCTVPVKVVSCQIDENHKTEDQWRITFTCDVIGDVTWAGFGSAPDNVANSTADLELYEGKVTSLDPDSLQDGATVMLDAVGITPTDAAEVLKMQSIVATAVPPIVGLKVRAVSMVSRDPFGCTFAITFARTTTGEDVINAGTETVLDPLGVKSMATATGITGMDPVAPTAAELQEVATATAKLNDGVVRTTKRYGVLNSHQELEYPHNATVTDPQSLTDSITLSDVFPIASPPADPEPPAGMKLRRKLDRPVTPTQSIRIYEWAYTDSKDDQEYPHRRSSTDPDGLEDEAIWAEVWLASGEAPEAPVFEGLKLRSTQDLHVESNPAYKVRVWTFRRTTTGEDIVNRNTSLTTDVSGLETTGKKAAWNATPEPHAGLVARNETVLVFNDDKTLHVIEEGLETVQAQRERQASSETVDANELDGQLVAAAISATEPAKPSAPAGLVFRHWKKQKQEDGRYLWTAVYGPADSKQEIEFGSTVSIDVDTLDASAAVVVVQNEDAPSWPETPPFTGAVAERYRRDRQLSQTRWQYTYIYSYETPAQKLVREATQETIDPTGINSTATTAGFDEAAPAHPTLVKVAERSRQLPNGHTLNEADWGTANTAQAIVRGLARSVTDPAGIDDQAIVATLGTESAGSDGGLTLARTEISYAKDGSAITQKVYDRVGDGAARRTLSSWRVHLDARTYETTSEPEVITCDLADLRTTAAAIFAENQANVEFEGVTLDPLPGGKALKTLHWAKDDKLLDVSIRSEWQSMRSVYVGGVHKIACSRVLDLGGGVKNALISPISHCRTVGTVRWRRRVIAETLGDVAFGSLIGKTNNGPMWDFAAYTLRYLGPQVKASYYITGSRLWVVDYLFAFDSERHPEDSQVTLGWVVTDGSPTVGQILPDALGWTIATPVADNFGVFTGTIPVP